MHDSPRPPPSTNELSGIARFALRLRLSWLSWREGRLFRAHERVARAVLALQRRLRGRD